jgi:hypothetical protein
VGRAFVRPLNAANTKLRVLLELGFFFNGANSFLRDLDEFDSDAHARQAIANLRARGNLLAALSQAELDVQNSALRKAPCRIDEHPARADVRGSQGHFFIPPFVVHGQLAKRADPGRDARNTPAFAVAFRTHSVWAP